MDGKLNRRTLSITNAYKMKEDYNFIIEESCNDYTALLTTKDGS